MLILPPNYLLFKTLTLINLDKSFFPRLIFNFFFFFAYACINKDREVAQWFRALAALRNDLSS